MRIFRVLGLAGALSVTVGAAHISSMKGRVSVRRSGAGPPAPGVLYAPLITGDHIGTGPNSRADVRFDPGNTFRVESNSEVRLAQSGSGDYQIELIAGVVNYNPLSASTVAVDTPIVSVTPLSEGVYHIAVRRSRTSEITVWEGGAEVSAASGTQSVSAGQKMIVRGSRSDPEFKIVSAVSFWRRAAFLMRDAIQIGVAVSSASSDDGDPPKPSAATPAAPPKNDGPKASPPPPSNSKPAPVIHGPPVRPSVSGKTASKD